MPSPCLRVKRAPSCMTATKSFCVHTPARITPTASVSASAGPAYCPPTNRYSHSDLNRTTTGETIMKQLMLAALVGSLSLASGVAVAQSDFPNQPIRLIVPYSAGGVTDQVGRALAEQMGQRLGQSVVVENKTGANGTMGAIQMLQAKPDGYTITMVPIGIYRMPHITGAPYDPARDFTYISQVAGYDYYLAVKGNSQWRTLDDLASYAKSHADSISYGTPGAYSSQHIAMVQLSEA